MSADNFIVRANLEFVDKYKKANAWEITPETIAELDEHVAGLPSEKPREATESKQFDYLMIRLQIAFLKKSNDFTKIQKAVIDTAKALELKQAIPMVINQLELIQELQTDSWWQDVTLPMLESVRKQLRALVVFIERTESNPVIVNFRDQLGVPTEITRTPFSGINVENFRDRARNYLQAHMSNPAIMKLMTCEPLTSSDLEQLAEIVKEPAQNDPDLLIRTRQPSIGNFVRSLVGLNREVARARLNQAIGVMSLSSTQMHFINEISEHLAQLGFLDPVDLYEARAFSDINAGGIDAVFTGSQVDSIFAELKILNEIPIESD